MTGKVSFPRSQINIKGGDFMPNNNNMRAKPKFVIMSVMKENDEERTSFRGLRAA